MSTAAANQGGFVVITEISPKTNQGDHSQTGQPAIPTSTKRLEKFYKGEPMVLGVSQILNGIIQIVFGIVCDFGTGGYRYSYFPLFVTGVPYWSGLLFIVSGSLSVATANNPKISLLRGSLVMNIISSVASGIATIIYIVYICAWDSGSYRYSSCSFYQEQERSEELETCKMRAQNHAVFWAMLFILLIMSVLELCVSISVSAFGCKTICRTAYSEVSVVIYQTTAPNPGHQPHPDVSAALTSQPHISEILPP
ncbi:membrane-spanning 4-domains subfamily A member 4D-like [Lissotriton helveticus]